jgi:hypothetical protein
MMIFYIILIQLVIFEKYISNNLKIFGLNHSSIELLIIYIIISTISNIIILFKRRAVYLNLSMILFICFLIYFAYRCAVDLSGQDWSKLFIGSDAGILYYLILGIFTAAPISYIIEKEYETNRSNKLFKYLIGIFIIFCIKNSLELTKIAWENSRSDIFLVEANDEMYQWPGDLLSMRVLILTMYTGYLISLINRDRNLIFRKTGVLLLLIIQAIHYGALIFYAQVIGSNKSVLIIVGCWLILFSVMVASPVVLNQAKYFLRSKFGIFSLMRLTILHTAGLTTVIVGLLYLVATIFNFPFDKFRVFGFGQGDISSINSRIDLFEEVFILQFSISPFFGNAAADYNTLGEGYYVHSIVAYALTHTGIIGFILLTGAFIMAIAEQNFKLYQKKPNTKEYSHDYSWLMKYIVFYLFLLILLIGIISSSLIWGLLWFGVGLFLASWRSKGPYLKLLI